MGIRAFVSIPDVQNSRFRPILGQPDLPRRDQARFKPIKHASNQRNICLGLPSPPCPDDSVGCGARFWPCRVPLRSLPGEIPTLPESEPQFTQL